ncbi:MAG: DEAD/DEAH box helicase family protein [Bacteroidetes bacterium]|nr:DEAD/DEAH box helicase family protein [Bacteroidota bacterium]
MALPFFIKYIYTSATDEVIRRGKKMYSSGNVQLVTNNDLDNQVVFRVRDDHYNAYYKVTLQHYDDVRNMTVRCTCAYNLGEICRHSAAALMQMQDLVNKNLLTKNEPVSFDQKFTEVRMKFIDLKMIRHFAGIDNYAHAEELLRKKKCSIISAENETVTAELETGESSLQIILRKNEERFFDTSCQCDEHNFSLCLHKTALFLQLLNNFGPYYFDSLRNWDKEKNKLLQSYGYSLDDDLTDKFEFVYKENKPYLKILNTSIKKISAEAAPIPHHTVATEIEEQPSSSSFSRTRKSFGIVFNFNEPAYPFFTIDLIQGAINEEGKFIDKIEKADLTKYFNPDGLSENNKSLLQLVRKVQQNEINKYLNRNSPFSGFWENIVHTENEKYPEETKLLIAEFLYPRLKRIFTEADSVPVFALFKGKKFTTANLTAINISNHFPPLEFEISKVDDVVLFNGFTKINSQKIFLYDNEQESNLIFLHEDILYLWQFAEQGLIATKFRNPLQVPAGNWPTFLNDVVMPLTRDYSVNFDKSLIKEIKEGDPEVSLKLLEKGDYLVFQPTFSYKGYSVKDQDKETLVVPDKDKVLLVKRNKIAEEEFLKKLESLHSQFIHRNDHLVLRGADVLKNNWFFLFVDAMKEMKVPVYGFETLKNFRFNTARPTTKIHVSNHVDWFDANVELVFDNQKIGIKEIQKALAARQSFVQLDDGTLGILPDEWIKKYALLFKVGEGKNNRLRLSKFHLSVIDELYEHRDEEEISFDLDEKFEKLRNFKSIPETAVPEGLAGTLRPYQVSGFQWLHYLNEVGWGGILADDMGLGKTVQALSMFNYVMQETNTLSALVVCPTTLIYNWENEIKKFTPSLTFAIHHGNTRARVPSELEGKNVIITTYGTLRSDIQMLMKIHFDYAVLDESQAIKNPFSKVTRAAGLLNAKNKVCMSGTPLQNNTFDIYAQMNFLNPGLLGSVEFFRNEFSVPIDKLGEQEQKSHLRKLLFPFILRRTKEQVAKDLPEKTETILYCEMEEKQRAIYESYRHAYRSKILGLIDDQGVGKSQLTILQGLMKLRQICDSPAILNEDEKYPNESIKLDELVREITENIGEHKALVFSQFLGMLALIKEKLKENNIDFEYFDGSTLPADREKAIKNFQNNENCRVFLISLKAGGVGLNLTAADYVYIVDPWWNPAVEQQAIDRTHRIGQTKNIFAYRMICKDTIEDKIMQLQDRKRILAKELIADDQSFVKGLTKEDVEYLFN